MSATSTDRLRDGSPRTRQRASAVRVVAALAVLLWGCGPNPAVEAWLLCTECEKGELAALGAGAVPALADALQGPSIASRIVVRQQLIDSYRSMQGVSNLTEQEYRRRLISNYVASYQKRAAVALGQIGGERARQELREAVDSADARHYRSDVRRTVASMVATVSATRYDGIVVPGRVRFRDTVTVRPGGLPWSGDEWVMLLGSPFPDSLVLFRSADSIRFLAVAPPGRHVITVSDLGGPGAGGITQVADLEIESYRASPPCSPPVHPCIVSRAPDYTSLTPGHREYAFITEQSALLNDSAVYYRFEPALALQVTATLDWSGSSDLNIRWLTCATFSPTGNASGATTNKPEVASVTVPAGACWLAEIKGAAGRRVEITEFRATP